jgi:hypothetical protein
MALNDPCARDEEATRFQFERGPRWPGVRRLQGPHVPLGAQQILDVVAVFVGDHIGLCKVSAPRVKAPLQLAEET